jgi:uncharacterized membrane protein
MKPLTQFIRHTLTGGILLLLPLVLLIMVLNKAHVMLLKISAPIAEKLPDIILGFDGSNLLAIILIVILCFIGGLMFRSANVRSWIAKFEETVLSLLPGYSMLKSIAADAVGQRGDQNLRSVLVEDDDSWNIGFLVEEKEELCMVFFPEAPRHDSGEVKIVPSSRVRKLDIPVNIVVKSLKSYGKGALAWMK